MEESETMSFRCCSQDHSSIHLSFLSLELWIIRGHTHTHRSRLSLLYTHTCIHIRTMFWKDVVIGNGDTVSITWYVVRGRPSYNCCHEGRYCGGSFVCIWCAVDVVVFIIMSFHCYLCVTLGCLWCSPSEPLPLDPILPGSSAATRSPWVHPSSTSSLALAPEVCG